MSPAATPATTTLFIALSQRANSGTSSVANSVDVYEWLSWYQHIKNRMAGMQLLFGNIILYLGRTLCYFFLTTSSQDDMTS